MAWREDREGGEVGVFGLEEVMMSDGNFNRALLPHTPYASGLKMGKAQMRKRAVEGLRVFSLNRIRQVSVGGEKFRMRRDFSPQTYFSECFGVYPGVDCEAERIVLRAYGQTPHYLRDLPLHHSQRELETVGDHTDFELFLRATPDFLNHLLVHGAGLQIVSPSSVADKMREIICGLARRYDFPYSVSHDHKTT